MGIIRAGISAIRGAAADQWKEAFCAPEMGSELLITRARKLTGQNGSNNGSIDVITHGSLIIVGEGECAIATEGGKVIGVYEFFKKSKTNQERTSSVAGRTGRTAECQPSGCFKMGIRSRGKTIAAFQEIKHFLGCAHVQ